MKFGYFTLSDNHYSNSTRTANSLVMDIVDEAIYAETLGYHSAWLGEHHFNSLGVLSCPDIALAYVAARTRNIRLAPAVTVLPIHHPIRVAEQWATLDLLSGGRVDFATGRGYDRGEYLPFKAPFDDNAAAFAEGLGVLHRLWTSDKPISHHGKYYDFDDVAITPQPIQRPIPVGIASFSQPTIELAGRYGFGLVIAAFAATITLGSIAEAVRLYTGGLRQERHTSRGRMVSSYFIHFADTPEEERAGARAAAALLRANAAARYRPAPARPRPRATTTITTSRTRCATRGPRSLNSRRCCSARRRRSSTR